MAVPSKRKVRELFYGGGKLNDDGWKQRAERGLREQHKQIREDYVFYAHGVKDYKRRDVVKFNQVKPKVDPVIGFFIQMRRKPQYLAKLRDAQEQVAYSQYMSSLADYMRSNANAGQIESRQDGDLLICGVGATDAAILYEGNPDGEYIKERLDPLETWWDPTARAANNLDAQYVFRRNRISLQQAMDMLDASEEDFEDDTDNVSTDEQFLPTGGVVNKIGFDTDKRDGNMVNLYYLQWWDYENYWRIENPLRDITDAFLQQQLLAVMQSIEESQDEEVEDLFTFDPTADFLVVDARLRAIISSLLDEIGVKADFQKFKKKVYYTAMLSGKKVFDVFKSPDQQGFTIKFKTGTWDNAREVWCGLVRDLKEPSAYYNKTLTEILRVIASNSKGGVMYEKSAVPNPTKFESEYAKNKAAIQLNDGGATGIIPKAQPALPTGFEKINAEAQNALNTITPVNAEFLGTSQNKQVSAAMENQRIRQATTSLAIFADSISLYQIEDARQLTSFARILAENSETRLIKIVGADGAPVFEQLLESRLADEYDIDIGEAPTTPTQRQEVQGIMLNVAQQMMATTGQNLYPIALRYMDGVKEQDKQDMIAALTPPEPSPEEIAAQQQAEQEAQAIIKESQLAELEKTTAETRDKEASAAQRMAQVAKTEQEALQKSLENDAIANGSFEETTFNI